jgi:gliding motility-associated-like protein
MSLFASVANSQSTPEEQEAIKDVAKKNLDKMIRGDAHMFRENVGQWEDLIRYRSLSKESSITFFDQTISFGLKKSLGFEESVDENGMPVDNSKFLVWNLDFLNSNKARFNPGEKTNRNVNYFGSGSYEAKSIDEYRRLGYEQIYDGVDFLFYNTKAGQLKYDIILAAGADLNAVQIQYSGLEDIEVNAKGQLVLHTAWGNFVEETPVSYQVIDGIKKEVEVVYQLDSNVLSYEILSGYNPNYELVIDPLYVDWSTFFYGEKNSTTWGWTWVLDLDIDNEDNVYITGMTTEAYPYDPDAFDTSINAQYDVFVCKMNPRGDSILFFSYLGGSKWEYGLSVSVNDQQEATLSGITMSSDFPITPGAFQSQSKSNCTGWCYQGFVTKFNKKGTGLVFSTFLGGSAGGWSDWIRGMALNDNGDIYLVGNTQSTDFPVTSNAYQKKYKGGSGTWYAGDAFLTIMKKDGSGLLYSSYLGGTSDEVGHDLFINESGHIYVVGSSKSNNFPTTPGAKVFNTAVKGAGTTDGFITKFSKDGTKILYSHLMGGTGNDVFEGIYSNGQDEPYVVGYSSSGDFPVSKKAVQKSNAGGYDFVVVKMVSSGTNFHWSTYLGGSGDEFFWNSPFFSTVKITANVKEQAIISGVTRSNNFPVTPDALQKKNRSTYYWAINLSITKLNFDASKILYATYFGGDRFEYPGAITAKKVGCVSYILSGGLTASSDYPTTKGVFREDSKSTGTGWSYSGYVTKFRDTLYTEKIDLNFDDTIVECDNVFEILDGGNRGADFLWHDGTKKRFKILQDTGLAWVRATYGCDTVGDSLFVILEYSPTVPVLGPDTTYCDIFPATLIDAKNDTILRWYEWADKDTAQTKTITSPGVYTVEIFTPNCGSKVDSVRFKLLKTPNVDLGLDSIFCDSVSHTFDAKHKNQEATYRWSTGDSLQLLTVKDTGVYSVTVSNFCGSDSAKVNYGLYHKPVALLPADSIFCDNILWGLKVGRANNNETYKWTKIGKSISYGNKDSIDIKEEGYFRVSIANNCGTSLDSVDISMLLTPISSPIDTSYQCDVVNIALSAKDTQNAETHLWNTAATTKQITALKSGLYFVTSTNKCGVITDSTEIILKNTPQLLLPPDTIFCNTIGLDLDITSADPEATYNWRGAGNSPKINVSDTGLYHATLTNRCGTVSDSIRVQLLKSPTVGLGVDEVFCGSLQAVLKTVGLPSNGETYQWSNSDNTASSTLIGEGDHWVIITNKCGTATDTFNMRVSALPIVDLGPDTTLCGNFNLLLDAGNPGLQYDWMPFGETSQVINATDQVVYTVTVTNVDGCTGTSSFEIDDKCVSEYYVPSAFSPNGDRLNEIFKPTLVNFENYTMQVFNRWGQVMFTSDDIHLGWNGRYQDELVPLGVYYYSIRFVTTENGEFKTISGPIRVMR